MGVTELRDGEGAGGGAALYCPECGYDLRGTPGEVCPECGAGFDRSSATRSGIPWEVRGVIGRWRGYWRTVALVTVRPGAVARAAASEVSFAAASRFRWVTVVLSTVWVWGVMGVVYGIGSQRVWDMLGGWRAVPPMGVGVGRGLDVAWPLGAAVMAGVVYPVCAVLMVIGLSGMHTYFFHPRSLDVERQNRAVAVSYYACGVMAWGWVPAGLACTYLWTRAVTATGGVDPLVLSAIGAVGSAVVFAGLMLRAVLVMQRAVEAGAERVAWVGAAVVGLWAGVVVLTMGVVPWAVGLGMLMWASW